VRSVSLSASSFVLCLVFALLAGCSSEPAASGAADEAVPVAPKNPTDPASVPEPTRVLELQSSGSLGFVIVAGPEAGGWCALLAPAADGADAWSADRCKVSTAVAGAERISYAVEPAPASSDVRVLYGLVPLEVAKVVVDLESGSTSSSLEAGPSPRSELGDFGSFSLFLRPALGDPVRIRLLDSGGAELEAIEL